MKHASAKKHGQLAIPKDNLKDFWSLKGSLSSDIKLSDKELREARESWTKNSEV